MPRTKVGRAAGATGPAVVTILLTQHICAPAHLLHQVLLPHTGNVPPRSKCPGLSHCSSRGRRSLGFLVKARLGILLCSGVPEVPHLRPILCMSNAFDVALRWKLEVLPQPLHRSFYLHMMHSQIISSLRLEYSRRKQALLPHPTLETATVPRLRCQLHHLHRACPVCPIHQRVNGQRTKRPLVLIGGSLYCRRTKRFRIGVFVKQPQAPSGGPLLQLSDASPHRCQPSEQLPVSNRLHRLG